MDQVMKNVQNTEIEILDLIHKICTENNLRYSLAYGTLIGAVRHKGFIPWDDDIDLMMPRQDYEKLIKIWNHNTPDGFVMETEDNTVDLPVNHMKIRKDHTAFIQSEAEKFRKYHKGIFIDIFPGDRVAPGFISRKYQFILFALHLLYNRGHASHKTGLISIPERFLLSVPRKYHRVLSRKFGKLSRKWNDSNNQFVFPCVISCCKIYYPADLFDERIELEFNGKSYFSTKDYDLALRLQYGDYMKLPPKEERVWAHHPLVVDFERNYEEIDHC